MEDQVAILPMQRASKKAFEEKIREKGLDKEIKVSLAGCFGLCETGPNVEIYPEGIFYSHIKVEDIGEIVEKHLCKGGEIVERLLYEGALEDGKIKQVSEVDFIKAEENSSEKLRNNRL